MKTPTLKEVKNRFPEGCEVQDWAGDTEIVKHSRIVEYSSSLIKLTRSNEVSIHLWTKDSGWAKIKRMPKPKSKPNFDPFF